MNKSKNILFLSSVNLSANPRIFKEIKLALSAGYTPIFIGFNLGTWSDLLDNELRKELKGSTFYYIDGTKKKFFKWFFSTFIHFICKKIYVFFPKHLTINAYASSKRTILLNYQIDKLIQNYNVSFILAHTLPCLFTAYQLKLKNNIDFAFDVEDYHPGEKIPQDIENEIKRRTRLMNSCLPEAKYVSCASPLIGKYTAHHVGDISKMLTVNNSFLSDEFINPTSIKGNVIKLVWFSQNISHSRGLEEIVEVLGSFKDQFHLTLIGNTDQQFVDKIISSIKSNITILPPLSQKNLYKQLADFDIGLALEQTSADLNRDIALTNKLFAYMQAGLYVLYTDTSAQVEYMKKYPFFGICSSQNIHSLRSALQNIVSTILEIRTNKMYRYQKAKEFSWENESKIVLKKWNALLN